MEKIKQNNLVFDSDNKIEAIVPTMPLLIIKDNGNIWEANSIRGAVSTVIGKNYLECKNSSEEWYQRLLSARKECMKSIHKNLLAEIYDKRKGLIRNNYAVPSDDPDYIVDSNKESKFIRFRIDNDRLFLLSLMKIDSIVILEREDSFQLRPHPKWQKLENGESFQSCFTCIHNLGENNKCPVYDIKIKNNPGINCSSYTFKPDKNKKDYEGREYIKLDMEYDIDKLMESVCQEWLL